ncbi:MAG: ATP-binding protein [bacterium]
MMFNFSSILLLIISAVNLVLGLLIIVRNRKSIQNILFSIMLFGITFWSLSLILYNLGLPETIYIWGQLAYLFSALTISLFLQFTLYFQTKLVNKFVQYLSIFLCTVYLVIAVIPFSIFSSITIADGLIETSLNWGYYLHSIMTFVLFGWALINLVIKYNKSTGIYRSQLVLILVGATISTVIAIFSNVILFSSTGLYNWLGPTGTIFLVGCITYAIVKHRLMDIRMVVARSVAYIILIVTLAGLYAGAVLGMEFILFPKELTSFSLTQGGLRTVVAVIMVFLFQPLKNWITKATDKIFFRGRYDADQLLSELSNTMSSTIVLVELLYRVSDLIQKNIKSTRVLTALVKDDTRMYNVQANGYKETPDVDPRDVYHLAKDGIIIKDDLEDGSKSKKLLTEYNATMAVPLKTDSEVIGVILLGEKNSGEMYNQQDMKVMEIIGPELAVAVENAKSYEEISKFNVTLRQEVKRATYRLKQKNSELQELDKAKDEFISMASHQLRTPLTAIKGYLSMLLEGDAGDIKVSQYDFINEAYSGANRMVGLINDLLNVSRMETGRFFLEPKEVDIERIVNEEVKQLSQQARTKGLYLKVENKGKVPHIWADETKIRQVVMNFMDNALYYTLTGGVTVTLRHDKVNLYYEVHDTGIGVPADQKRHLFEKFFRADNARTTRPDGTGLGIYLAKRVIEDHGGEIIFESEVGKGSMFGFKFPLKKKVGPKPISAPAPRTVHTAETMQAVQTEIVEKAAIK